MHQAAALCCVESKLSALSAGILQVVVVGDECGGIELHVLVVGSADLCGYVASIA